jgi:hypothetical protein
MDEKTFWRSTPRKIFSLIACHVEANTTEQQRIEGNIKGRNKHNSEQQNKEVSKNIASW